MAKKKKTTTTTTTSNFDIIKFCAFWGLVIAAVAALLSFVLALLGKCGVHIDWAGRIIGVCNTVSQIALLVAVILPAYKYVRGKNNVYKALFWVAVILIVLGLVGINLAF
ncbi:MAG: hypothetical protein K2L42_00440 [Clostridia bacterium]|nr:hypothetical protein [Clostridia bacterium]